MYNCYKKLGDNVLHDIFHSNTAISSKNILDVQDRIDRAFLDAEFQMNAFSLDSTYAQYNSIIMLPDNNEIEDDLLFYMKKRRSKRNFIPSFPLDDKIFSNLMRYSFGVSEKNISDGNNNMLKYMYPTAGGISALKIFVRVNNVKNIESNWYLYDPEQNALLKYESIQNFNYDDITACVELTENSFFSVHIIGNMQYLGKKYGDRAYRFLNIQAGHCTQNLYLLAAKYNLSAVTSGGGKDINFLKKMKIIDDKHHYYLYEMFIGNS